MKEKAGKIFDRFCKEKAILNKEREIAEIIEIVNSEKDPAHVLYVKYGADMIGKLNYNDHIKEINSIING